MISLLAGRYSSKTRHRQDLLFFHSLKMSYVIHMMEFSVWLRLVWGFLLPLITYYLTLDCNPLLSFCVLSRILSTDVIIWVLYYSHVINKVFQGFSPEIWTLTGTSLHLDSFLFESFSCRFTVVLGIIVLLHEPISVKFELSDRWPHIGIFWYTNELMVNSVTLRWSDPMSSVLHHLMALWDDVFGCFSRLYCHILLERADFLLVTLPNKPF